MYRILKNGTSEFTKDWFKVGDWKKLPNEIGGNKTTLPKDVELEMTKLNEQYKLNSKIDFEDIIAYHYQFEKIHPFQDGNGRVGRIIMYRECLKNDIIPFIIYDNHKQFYYRGLTEFENVREYLLDTCLSAQDTYKTWIEYFYEGIVDF